MPTITLHPTDDAGAWEDSPNYNSGGFSTLPVGDESDNDIMWMFVRFNILGALPPGADIISAKLRLYVSNKEGNGAPNFAIKRVLEEWDEDTLTWSNMPAIGGAYYSSAYESPSLGYAEYDMTEYVNDVLADGWDYGLALTAESDMNNQYDYLTVHTREGDYPPELIIEYELPPAIVKIIVKDKWGLRLPNAKVELDGQEMITNAHGEAVFSDITAGASYQIRVSRVNYREFEDTVYIEPGEHVFTITLERIPLSELMGPAINALTQARVGLDMLSAITSMLVSMTRQVMRVFMLAPPRPVRRVR